MLPKSAIVGVSTIGYLIDQAFREKKFEDEKLKIPMAVNKRSLNLATSVGIVLAEQIRQIKS